MQSFNEFVCEDCSNAFNSASDLLKHFALHVTQTFDANIPKLKKVPDLYPIANLKLNKVGNNCNNKEKLDNDDNVDSGFEDINPMKFCLVTMDAELNVKYDHSNLKSNKLKSEICTKTESKKYKCSFCSKTFGWSTDLKRHVMIHTGERPFKCPICKSSFTRNFLLQKHKLKYHTESDVHLNIDKITVPGLKPIILKEKRKQDKCKVKQKVSKMKHHFQNENKNNLICIT